MYEKFVQILVRNRLLALKNYYIGAIREERDNPKSRKLMRDQRILTSQLQRNGWVIKFGHMLKTDSYHEKGVDVQIAVDILIGAYENLYDIILLISSDTDLLPAIIKARAMKKRVEYIGFSHKPSMALIANSDIRRLFIKEEIEQFL